MESQTQVLIPDKSNNYNCSNLKDNFQIKAKNTCHLFKISFNISHKNSIPKEIQSSYIIESPYNELMIIQAELLNKNESYYIENIDKIEISEKYCAIYSLAELKNNISGFEWFLDLYEFKEAFVNGIVCNNYELLLIKNILLLSINFVNIFGISHILLKPCKSQNNANEHYFEDIKFNEVEKSDYSFICELNQNKLDETKYSLNNTSISNNKTNMKNEFIEKKRNKSKKNKANKSEFNKNSHINNNNFILDFSEKNINDENENNINNINNLIDNYIENFKKDIEKKIPEFQTKNLIKESIIIKNVEEESLIGDMISNLKIKKYRLIFRATRDGDSANIFHTLCDNYNKLVILIETQKGLRFGGYTSRNFRVSSHMKDDNNSFLFSLDLKKVFKIIPGKNAIYCYPKSGPCFSQESLYIPNNFFKKPGKTRIFGGPFQFEKDYEINNGEKNFLVKELEIFQVKYEDI